MCRHISRYVLNLNTNVQLLQIEVLTRVELILAALYCVAQSYLTLGSKCEK